MAIPYKVTVQDNKGEVHVVIRPQPIATKDEYIQVITGRFQKALTSETVTNTMLGRGRLKKELFDILKDFHKQGMIKPKEDEQ